MSIQHESSTRNSSMTKRFFICLFILQSALVIAQSGGRTADVNSANRAYLGATGGFIGNLNYDYFISPKLDVFVGLSLREKYILEGGAGANPYSWNAYGSLGFVMGSDQRYVKGKDFTRSYKFVSLGYQWHEQLVYDTGVPNGHVFGAHLNWCFERDYWQRFKIGIGYNLIRYRPNACPPGIQCSPWMPEIAYSIALPFYTSRR